MSNEVKLEIYTIRIRNSGDVKNFLKLDKFAEESDFMIFFQNYISLFDHQLELNENQKRSLKLNSKKLKINISNRIISGILESGDYGFESTIYDTNSGEETYKRKIHDTEIKPFYFLIHLPNGDDKGFVILQRLGIYGILGVFKYHITSYFKSKHESLQLDFSPFVSRNLAKAFIDNGSIREFMLTRYNLPQDIADKLGMNGHEEDIMSIELRIKARKNKSLSLNDKVKAFIENPNSKFFSMRELNDLGFDGEHKSKIKVSLAGSTRTIDLADTGQIRPYYDIDNEVKKDISGHPDFDSIDEIARKLITDLNEEIT